MPNKVVLTSAFVDESSSVNIQEKVRITYLNLKGSVHINSLQNKLFCFDMDKLGSSRFVHLLPQFQLVIVPVSVPLSQTSCTDAHEEQGQQTSQRRVLQIAH